MTIHFAVLAVAIVALGLCIGGIAAMLCSAREREEDTARRIAAEVATQKVRKPAGIAEPTPGPSFGIRGLVRDPQPIKEEGPK